MRGLNDRDDSRLRVPPDKYGKEPIGHIPEWRPGDNITAAHLNRPIKAINKLTSGIPFPKANDINLEDHIHHATKVVVIHSTNHLFSAGQIAGIERPSVPSTKSRDLDPVIVAEKPAKKHRGNWVVCHRGPAKVNDSFIASYSGIVWVKLYVADAAGAGMLNKWRFAEIDQKSTGSPWNLSLMPYGSARVLWMSDDGGGYRDALIQMHHHSFGADLNPWHVPNDGDTWSKWRHEMPDQKRLGAELELEFSDGFARVCRFDAKGHLVRVCPSDEATCPTPTPTPSGEATPTGEVQTPTPTPEDSGTPTVTPTPTDCTEDAFYRDVKWTMTSTCTCGGRTIPATGTMTAKWMTQSMTFKSYSVDACAYTAGETRYSWGTSTHIANVCLPGSGGPDCNGPKFPFSEITLKHNGTRWQIELNSITAGGACGSGSTCASSSDGPTNACDPTGTYTLSGSCTNTVTISWA